MVRVEVGILCRHKGVADDGGDFLQGGEVAPFEVEGPGKTIVVAVDLGGRCRPVLKQLADWR